MKKMIKRKKNIHLFSLAVTYLVQWNNSFWTVYWNKQL